MKKSSLSFLLFTSLIVGMMFLSVNLAFAQTVDLKNPLEFLEIGNDPIRLVIAVLAGFAAVTGLFAIAFTVFNGFKLIIATNEEAIETAKKGLTWSVAGFVVALLTFTIVAGTAQFLGFQPGLIDLSSDKIVNPIDIGDQASSRELGQVVLFVMRNFLGLIGFATILMIIYYGYKYLSSAGNEEAIEKAKTGLKWAIIGFIITLLAFTIISSVQRYLLSSPA